MRPDERARLLALVRALGPAGAQNSLMRLSDRELAISMTYMEDTERDQLFAHLSANKATRVREKVTLQRQLRITVAQYRVVVNAVMVQLQSPGATGTRSYLRPVNAPNAATPRRPASHRLALQA